MKTPFNIPNDKWLHLLVGMMIYIVFLMLINWFAAIIIVVVLAFLKEVNDRGRYVSWLLTSKNKKGVFDFRDFAFSIILPLIISAILSWLG